MSDELQQGDKVKFQSKEGVVVAVSYSDDRIAIAVTERSGGLNTHYGHISQLKPELVERAEPVVEPEPELPLKDEK